MSAIDQGRFTVAAGAVGLAQACLDASVEYAHERQTFGEEIGRHQLVKQMIAKMAAGTEMGRLLVWRAGWLKNQGLRNLLLHLQQKVAGKNLTRDGSFHPPIT